MSHKPVAGYTFGTLVPQHPPRFFLPLSILHFLGNRHSLCLLAMRIYLSSFLFLFSAKGRSIEIPHLASATIFSLDYLYHLFVGRWGTLSSHSSVRPVTSQKQEAYNYFVYLYQDSVRVSSRFDPCYCDNETSTVGSCTSEVASPPSSIRSAVLHPCFCAGISSCPSTYERICDNPHYSSAFLRRSRQVIV